MLRADRIIAAIAALSGGSCVAGGAFAAHALAGDARAASLLSTGASYGLWHALAALLAVAIGPGTRPAGLCFVIGIPLFTLSLFALALGAPSAVGAITPFGGTAFILGWLILAWRLWRQPG